MTTILWVIMVCTLTNHGTFCAPNPGSLRANYKTEAACQAAAATIPPWYTRAENKVTATCRPGSKPGQPPLRLPRFLLEH